ncbi:unnamed protein product [Didymodactylos carnosus]|uniref:LysM domain-containing protein n=1 Tax=Didymodactylos carnosus TaxID=1234261 RepID=A0A814JDL0_9BILA|nr:unnamed protein product [Didymodactylos carnosus]CAF3805105.1 unnamed protein product [Didymodactylos carnosus]
MTHTIVSGDTFWALARKYRCNVDEITAANPGVSPTKLQIGQVIRIPNKKNNTKASTGGSGREYDPWKSDETDVLTRTIWAEARGEPSEGQAAVAHTVLNRANGTLHKGGLGSARESERTDLQEQCLC